MFAPVGSLEYLEQQREAGLDAEEDWADVTQYKSYNSGLYDSLKTLQLFTNVYF